MRSSVNVCARASSAALATIGDDALDLDSLFGRVFFRLPSFSVNFKEVQWNRMKQLMVLFKRRLFSPTFVQLQQRHLLFLVNVYFKYGGSSQQALFQHKGKIKVVSSIMI